MSDAIYGIPLEKGWPVFPVRPRGKEPLTQHGFKDASTEEATIMAWWEKWPDANVGLPTGAASGLVVLDVDAKSGGKESLERLEKQHGPLPETVLSHTGGGGLHYFFKHPGFEMRNTAGKVAPGLDTRGDGGYVVLPPSVHESGNTYQWDIEQHPNRMEPAEIPSWLLELLREEKQQPQAPMQQAPVQAGEQIPEGTRDDTIYRLACAMRRRGHTEAEILAAMLVTNKQRCRPPLPPEQVQRKVASACKHPATETPVEQVKQELARQQGAIIREASTLASQKAGKGDISGAELELQRGLQELRERRGVQLPETYRATQLMEDIRAQRPGLVTGYEDLDSLVSIPSGALTILAGRPGHGKTTLLLNMLLNMVRQYPNKAFYFFSYEEACSRLAIKLMMILAGVMLHERFNFTSYFEHIKRMATDTTGRQTFKDKKMAVAFVELGELTNESGRLSLVDRSLTSEDLASVIGQLGQSRQLGGVFVDYIQKVRPQRPTNARYLDIKLTSELLLEQAKAHDIPIVLGCQLGRDTQHDGIKKVRLENLRESGDIEQDAALVLGIFNESLDKTEEDAQENIGRTVSLDVLVLKNRLGAAGGRCQLKFDRPVLTIRDTKPTF